MRGHLQQEVPQRRNVRRRHGLREQLLHRRLLLRHRVQRRLPGLLAEQDRLEQRRVRRGDPGHRPRQRVREGGPAHLWSHGGVWQRSVRVLSARHRLPAGVVPRQRHGNPAEDLRRLRGVRHAQSIESGVLVWAVLPDRAGACSCSSNAQCKSGDYCEKSVCEPKKPQGEPCALSYECATEKCVDGVCCNFACDAECLACSAVLKGYLPDGVCGGVRYGDPESQGICRTPRPPRAATTGSASVHPRGA